MKTKALRKEIQKLPFRKRIYVTAENYSTENRLERLIGNCPIDD
ncbi:MAG TPA: hypothetical protein VLH61_08800 [Bacteroidales bacterium]|nr:hypothetical protein [Bacteroidales bacterium]